MSKKQFNQQQKVVIVENAKEIGVKEASKIAGVHYTTVYEWSREVEAIGKEAFLAHETTRVGRGIKEISEKQEQLVLDTWRANPGYGPGQIRNQLRRQAETVSIRTVRRILEANGYKASGVKSTGEKAKRFEASRPLELGQMDILQFFIHKLQVYLNIGSLKKQIIDAIGSLRNLDLNQQEQVWNMIQSILDPKSTTESVTLFS